MDLGELVTAMRFVELTAKTRQTAIRALIQAANWEDEGIAVEKVLEAVEEREAAAQTLVSPDFALPHAFLDWDGDFRVVMGRSRTGVDYGVPTGQHVQLIVLLVLGRKLLQKHVEFLAALAELLKSSDFRQDLIQAKDTRAIDALLTAKAGLQPEQRPQRAAGIPKLTQTLIKQAMQVVESVGTRRCCSPSIRSNTSPGTRWSNGKGGCWSSPPRVATTSKSNARILTSSM